MPPPPRRPRPPPPPSLFPLLERRAASLLARRGKTRRDAAFVLLAPSQAPCLTSFLPLPLSISPRSLHPRAFPDFSPPRAPRESAVSAGTSRGGDLGSRKDSSESALAPPPPSSSALFLPSLTQDLSSCSLSPFGGSFLTSSSVLRIAFSREAPREAAPSRSRSLLSPYTRTYTRGARSFA